MRLLRAATLTAADIDRSSAVYQRWLDYEVVEASLVSELQALAWDAPAVAGARQVTLQPASGTGIYLRFIEQPIHPDYVPLRTYGWAAIELCTTDVLAVNERMLESPDFEIIGPPREIEGLSAIFPMQVRGPDGEIVYLTEIRDNLPDFHLPRAKSLIDHLFILVMAASDFSLSTQWLAKYAGLQVGRERMDIVYTMIANAFDLPVDDLHSISTLIHEKDVFIEVDQYPPAATPRPRLDGWLPPGIAIGTLWHPGFASLADAGAAQAIGEPALQPGCIYNDRPAVTLRDPDGTLVEIVAN
ncbi:MAG: hypothetical protein AAGH76_01475 [Pseudomonadota bacterium]